jgi:hypothetical protein
MLWHSEFPSEDAPEYHIAPLQTQWWPSGLQHPRNVFLAAGQRRRVVLSVAFESEEMIGEPSMQTGEESRRVRRAGRDIAALSGMVRCSFSVSASVFSLRVLTPDGIVRCEFRGITDIIDSFRISSLEQNGGPPGLAALPQPGGKSDDDRDFERSARALSLPPPATIRAIGAKAPDRPATVAEGIFGRLRSVRRCPDF